MEEIKKAPSSLFDLAEEKEDHPYIFAWSEDKHPCSIKKEEVLYSGNLLSLSTPSNLYVKNPFVLSKEALLQCEGPEIREGKDLSGLKISATLKLKNPRIEKLENTLHNLYIPTI